MSIRHHDVTVRANTAEIAVFVETRSNATHAWLLKAFIDICTTNTHVQNTVNHIMLNRPNLTNVKTA
jgi:hypothetical protein